MTKPPEVIGIETQRSPPFVTTTKRRETRFEHLLIAGAMFLLAAVAIIGSVAPINAAATGFVCFLAGYVYQKWESWELMYDD